MVEEFDAQKKVYLTRDPLGTARGVLHIEEHFESPAGTALLAAHEYLQRFRQPPRDRTVRAHQL